MPDVIARLQEEIKNALKAGEKNRTAVLRLLLAAVKQKAIDSGNSPNESEFLSIVEKMIKQRHDSIQHYKKAGRNDLQEQEELEIHLLQPYLPEKISPDELETLITDAISKNQATSIKDMGKIMALIKPELAGRADMSAVSQLVRKKLTLA